MGLLHCAVFSIQVIIGHWKITNSVAGLGVVQLESMLQIWLPLCKEWSS